MGSIATIFNMIWEGYFSIELPFLNNITIGTLSIAVFCICFSIILIKKFTK